jgi:hypothetical protein
MKTSRCMAFVMLSLWLLLAAGCNKPPQSKTVAVTPPASGEPALPASAAPVVETAPPPNAAADFDFTTFGGQAGKLSGLRGQPVVLNFWAAW